MSRLGPSFGALQALKRLSFEARLNQWPDPERKYGLESAHFLFPSELSALSALTSLHIRDGKGFYPLDSYPKHWVMTGLKVVGEG